MQVSPQAAAQELLKRREARRSLLGFVEYTTPKWAPGRIHREICAALDQVASGDIDRLMLPCPPQHGKSTITSKRAPAYMLGRRPDLDIISGSASSPLAEEFGGEVRNCVGSPEFGKLFPSVTLLEDTRAKGRWRTEQGGGYYAVGIGGALFGRGAGLGIIDDPFATWEDAQSKTAKDKVWNWYTGTFYNRIRPGGAIIVIQHRTGEDDLVGRLLDAEKRGGDKWHVVKLTADINNPPWAERYDVPALARIKANTDPRQWASLYMQDPTPEDGTFFKRDWFKRYRHLPANLHYYITSDHAPSGGEGNDSTCVRVWGVDALGEVYLVDGFRSQETLDVTAEKVIGDKEEKKRGLIQKYKPFAWFPEDDNNWKSIQGFVRKALRKEGLFIRLEPISPNGRDKPTKAQAFQGLASSGMVHLPDTPEGDDILTEYLKFPAGKHDDEVDAASLIGRALAETHDAIAPRDEPAKKVDRWARAFGDNDENLDNWKTA